MAEAAPVLAAPAAAHDESSRAIARSAFHLVLGQVAQTAISIFISAAVGRFLGAVDYGVLYLASTIAAFASVFVDWGHTLYVVREVARHPETGHELLGSTLVFRILATLLVSLGTFGIATALGYDLTTRGYTVLVIVTSLPYLLASAYYFVFRGRERMDYFAAVDVSNKVLSLLFIVPALALGGRVASVILAQGLAGAGALAVGVVLYRRMRLPAIRVTAPTLRALVAGGTPMMAMTLAIALQPYVDAILLSKLAPAAVVGWYGAARNFMGVLYAPATILGTAAFPRLAKAHDDPVQFGHELRTALRPLAVLGSLGAVGTFLFADLAVSLVYGREKFGPAVAVLQIFAPGLFLTFVDMLIGGALLALHKSRQLAGAKFAAVALGGVLDLFLIPWSQARWGNGGIGVVISFSLAELVIIGAALVLLPRGALNRAVAADVAKALGIGAVTLAAIGPLPLHDALRFPACVVLFGLLALVTGLVTREDRVLLRSLFRRG